LRAEDGASGNTTGGTDGDHDCRDDAAFLDAWGLVLAVGKSAGDVGLAAEDGEEETGLESALVRGNLGETAHPK